MLHTLVVVTSYLFFSRSETASILTAQIVRGINMSFYSSFPYVVGFIIFSTFYAMGGTITLSVVFQTISLMFACRFEIINMLPAGIQMVNEMKVSCRRIQVNNVFFLESTQIELSNDCKL